MAVTALRSRVVLGVACCICAVPAGRAEPAAKVSTDIPAQSLSAALAELGRQTGLQLVYASNLVEGKSSPGAQAGLAPSAALAEMLSGTKLRFEFLNERTIGLFPAEESASTEDRTTNARSHRAQRSGELGLAVEEVIVTATRREEQASRVPISMTVWTQDTMEASGIKNMGQLSALTPGINFSYVSGIGADLYTNVDIRGVVNRHGAVISIFLDDVPLPPARAATYLRSFPYIFDLDRVEVLRGPQSMLLGDHTQAGALKFFMNQPSLNEYSALARAEWATTAGGAPGYELGAAAGGPIVADKVGFRASIWYQLQGGYVDRVDPITAVTVVPSANSVVAKMTHAALSFVPNEAVTITPSVTGQSTTNRDTSTFLTGISEPRDSEFRNLSLVPQPFTDDYVLTALRIAATPGPVQISSLTSYLDRTVHATLDTTVWPVTDYAQAAAWYPSIDQKVLAQELRLFSNSAAGGLRWMAGVLYSREHSDHTQLFVADGVGTPGDSLHVNLSEFDAFGELEHGLRGCLTATAGLRWGHSRRDYHSGVAPASAGTLVHDWTAPRIVLSCQDDGRLYYASVAKGIGSGGVHPDPWNPHALVVWEQPDEIWSYEIGTKLNLAGGRAHLDMSLFHIGWNNGQPGPGSVGSETGQVPGAFVSNGIDLAAQAQFGERLQLALAAEYADVRFTESVTRDGVIIARKGDSLGTVPLSITASVSDEMPLNAGVSINLRIEDVYRGRQAGHYFAKYQGQVSDYLDTTAAPPSTNVVNLRAAIRWPRLDVALLASNALNAHPLIQSVPASIATNIGTSETIIPRTISLTGTWKY